MKESEFAEYDAECATHKLMCSHCIGKSRKTYAMKCIPIKETRTGKLKIVVFGRMYWQGTDSHKRIRYVDKSRVKEQNPPSIAK